MIVDINKKYRTEGGSEVRIYATDCGGLYSVHGAYRDKNGWNVSRWTPSGAHWSGVRRYHLVEVKEKRVVYVNVYPGTTPGVAHKSRDAADRNTTDTRIARVRVEFEEGQFDE
jgi:hypothetical protein